MINRGVSFGVYGFEITRPIVLPGLELTPIYENDHEAQRAARQKGQFNLTCLGRLDSASLAFSGGNIEHVLFDLEAALTVCEQQYVVVTRGYPDELDVIREQLPNELAMAHPRHTPGELIQSDAFSRDSRREYLDRCLSALDEAEGQRVQLRKGLHKYAEIWRLREPFIDLTYYLTFSTLEGMSRAWLARSNGSAEEAMALFLRDRCEFDVGQNRPGQRERAMSTYAHLRNALFHNGMLETRVVENGTTVTFRITEYAHKLERLLGLALLRMIKFDDGRTNWNQWLDRQPFC
jgi:hypothetical protein